MTLLAGSLLAMNDDGVVSGTTGSLARALGDAHAARFIAPALAELDAAIAAATDPTLEAALEDQKLAVIEAWNDQQAPWLKDMANAIIDHIVDNADITMTISATSGGAGLQRVPDPATPGEPTDAPSSDVFMPCTIE